MPPRKEIYLFDTSNSPLSASVRVELFNAATGTLVAAGLSSNLTPGTGEWGVILSFSPCTDPFDICIVDKTYRYPGGSVRSLNGLISGRIDLDLECLPPGGGGHSSRLESGSLAEIEEWIQDGRSWSDREKRAVRGLITSFFTIVGPHRDKLSRLNDLKRVADNWSQALDRLGVNVEALVTSSDDTDNGNFSTGAFAPA